MSERENQKNHKMKEIKDMKEITNEILTNNSLCISISNNNKGLF